MIPVVLPVHLCRNRLSIAASVLLVCACGCSEQVERFPVAGKVLVDGEPLATGTIQFVPEEGRPAVSKISDDGSFKLLELSVSDKPHIRGVAKGRYRIGVSASEIIDEDKGEVLKHVPAHYADFRTSHLEVEINGPLENMIIELTWEGSEERKEEEEQGSVRDESADQASEDQIPTQEPEAEAEE